MTTQVQPKAIYRQKLSAHLLKEDAIPFSGPVKSSFDAATAGLLFWDLDEIRLVEHFYALYLKQNAEPAAWARISTGTTTGCLIDMKVLIAHGILCNATNVIVFHNHPSGSLTPSNADFHLTKKIKEATALVGIHLLEHIILSPDGNYHSFSDNDQLK